MQTESWARRLGHRAKDSAPLEADEFHDGWAIKSSDADYGSSVLLEHMPGRSSSPVSCDN